MHLNARMEKMGCPSASPEHILCVPDPGSGLLLHVSPAFSAIFYRSPQSLPNKGLKMPHISKRIGKTEHRYYRDLVSILLLRSKVGRSAMNIVEYHQVSRTTMALLSLFSCYPRTVTDYLSIQLVNQKVSGDC